VGRGSGAIAPRIDGVELRALTARFHDKWPQVDVRAEDVRAPGDDQPRVPKLLRLGTVLESESLDETLPAGRGADSTVQLRRAEAVEKAPVHSAPVEKAHRPGIAVRQDRLRGPLTRNLRQARGDGVERFLPRDALETALALGADATLRV